MTFLWEAQNSRPSGQPYAGARGLETVPKGRDKDWDPHGLRPGSGYPPSQHCCSQLPQAASGLPGAKGGIDSISQNSKRCAAIKILYTRDFSKISLWVLIKLGIENQKRNDFHYCQTCVLSTFDMNNLHFLFHVSLPCF